LRRRYEGNNNIPIPKPSYNGYRGSTWIETDSTGKEKLITLGEAFMKQFHDVLEVTVTEIPPTITISRFIEWLSEHEYDFQDSSSPDEVNVSVHIPLQGSPCEAYIYEPMKWSREMKECSQFLDLIKMLRRTVPIECKIVSTQSGKTQILDFTRQELFEHFFEQSCHYFELLRTKKIQEAESRKNRWKSMRWCIQQLINVELRTIDKEIYLNQRLKEDLEKITFRFDNSTIKIDYRVSQLSLSYIATIDDRIEKLEDEIISIKHSTIVETNWI
jgi:hypothetical protein